MTTTTQAWERTNGIGRLRSGFSVLSLAFYLMFPARSEAALIPSADKISPIILAHRELKRQPMGLSIAEHRSNLLAQGLNSDNLEGEECALYSTNRLSHAEIVQLAAQGIVVTPDLWIPPVAGHHPSGFHLATVSYASLDTVRADARFMRLESTEFKNKPKNDLACSMINADDVHNGTGITACTGAGIKVAVADSGMDLTHSDFPTPVEAYDMTTGTSPATWSVNVANTVSAHGTHVTGTVVGRGTLSSGKYQGSAPGAALCFYKIGDNSTGNASDADMIEAINRAATVGAKIFSMSYGGFSTYMDGSESVEQAIDAAVATGMTVFIAAGNEANAGLHYSVSVAPATTSDVFAYSIANATGFKYTTSEYIQVIWRDNTVGDYNMSIACTNLGSSESIAWYTTGSSSTRGTESRQFRLKPSIATGASKTYYFRLQNTSASGSTPLVHCYQMSGIGTFNNPDSSYTVGHPAVADGAIAVGAWTQRRSWTTYKGASYYYPVLTVGTLATFSSMGPRIDGVRKPDIVAPGAATISARDSVSGLAADDALIIDNDGATLDGSGPANYYVMLGTSMACPMAAGVGALILEKNPTATPSQVRNALTATAAMATSPNNSVGYGLINALTAVGSAITSTVTVTVFSSQGGIAPGTVTTNWGTTLNQWVTNSPIAVGVSTQHVCTAGTVVSNAYTQAATTNVTFTLTNNATLTWLWQTQYRLTTLTNGNGTVTAVAGWCAAGSNAMVTASANTYWHFTGWGGDTDGCTVADNTLTAAMTKTRTVVANFAETFAPKGTPEQWLAQYGLTNDSLTVEELTDSDGDGVPAWEEYVADTDPTNAASVLAFTGLVFDGTSVRLDWKGGQWAKQYLDAREDLVSTDAFWTCVLTNATLPTSITNFTIQTDVAYPKLFYRIRVER